MEFKDKNLLIITNSYPNKDNSHYGGEYSSRNRLGT